MIKLLGTYIIALCFLVSCKNNEAVNNPVRDVQNKAVTENNTAKKTILFFGNSLTAGYGLEPAEAFPALIQHKIDSLRLKYTSVNAGVSGETSAGGNGRIEWILKSSVDVFVLELGANDGLRGIPITETKKNLQAIIDKVKTNIRRLSWCWQACRFLLIWVQNIPMSLERCLLTWLRKTM